MRCAVRGLLAAVVAVLLMVSVSGCRKAGNQADELRDPRETTESRWRDKWSAERQQQGHEAEQGVQPPAEAEPAARVPPLLPSPADEKSEGMYDEFSQGDMERLDAAEDDAEADRVMPGKYH